jgi:hypothetical protein
MYLRMNTLLFGPSALLLGTSTRTGILKSTSGNTTPAPRSKVLRWKDLEAATAEIARQRKRGVGLAGLRSCVDVVDAEEEADGEEEQQGGTRDVEEWEEMFV